MAPVAYKNQNFSVCMSVSYRRDFRRAQLIVYNSTASNQTHLSRLGFVFLVRRATRLGETGTRNSMATPKNKNAQIDARCAVINNRFLDEPDPRFTRIEPRVPGSLNR